MKTLSVVGTAAIFMVGGGILSHGLPPVKAWISGLAANLGNPLLAAVIPTLLLVEGLARLWKICALRREARMIVNRTVAGKPQRTLPGATCPRLIHTMLHAYRG